MSYPKRLIEVDLPIARISAHARREKSIRHGHISTLHIWWARRPLAACRAVICAALWPDPADPLCPLSFRRAASHALTAFARRVNPDRISDEKHQLQATLSGESRGRWEDLATGRLTLNPEVAVDMSFLRMALLDFIADFANWDNSTVPAYLETSRTLTQAAHEALGGSPGTRPLVVDPFAGGGSIPLEALRVGADAFASDVNPVPVLLNKMVLEFIPKYGNQLAKEVRRWGDWIKNEAEKELAEFYPRDPDGATPIAYLWARTIRCEGPGCGAEVPLIRSVWLAKKANCSVALRLVPNLHAKRVDFDIVVKQREGWVSQTDSSFTVPLSSFSADGTVKRGSATCPCCGYTTPVEQVRAQLRTRQGGAADARLYCKVVTTIDGVTSYRASGTHDFDAIAAASQRLRDVESCGMKLSTIPLPPEGALGFRVQKYGMTEWAELFLDRQKLQLLSYLRIASVVPVEDPELQSVLSQLFALTVSKLSSFSSTLCVWRNVRSCVAQTFGRQTLSMVWDFGEMNPFAQSAGDFGEAIEYLAKFVEHVARSTNGVGAVQEADAAKSPLANDCCDFFFTDPPYYDAIPYHHLSGFFVYWLNSAGLIKWNAEESKRQRNAECIVDEGLGKTTEFFETTMSSAMREGRRITKPSALGVLVFAHKSTVGWEAQLNAMLDAGWIVTSSWPIDTERSGRLRAQDSAALASSIHITCRPREDASGAMTEVIGEWRDVLGELPKRIHEWMPRLAAEGVVGADAIFACLGPALEVFSRYSRVEKANGETATLREYLEHVWAAVSTEALSLIFKDASAAGLEPDARLTAMWLWTIGGGGATTNGQMTNTEDTDEEIDQETSDDDSELVTGRSKVTSGFTLEYDAARKIAQGLGIHLERSESLVEVKGDKARLIPVAERTAFLFGKDASKTTSGTGRKKKLKQRSLFDELDEVEAAEAGWIDLKGPPPGTTVLDRVHQAMILFAGNRGELLKRFLVEDGVGKDDRFWKLADNLNKLYPTGTEERRWVEGVLARKKGLGL